MLDKATIQALIRSHNGCVSGMAREARVSRPTMTKYLAHHDLADVAAKARMKGGVTGPRRGIAREDADPREEARVRAAYAGAGYHPDEAARRLGVSRSALYRLLRVYGISAPHEPFDVRRAKVLDALERGKWTQTGAGRILGVAHTTVNSLMRELHISKEMVAERRSEVLARAASADAA